ncbi:uroporphyrinogen decarboxylase family protein [Chloroflexota bacterium]
MSQHTARERVMAAIKGQYLEAVPVSVNPGTYSAKIGGCTIREFETDAGKSAKAQIAAYEILKPDTASVTLGMSVFAEAVGSEIEFPENAFSLIKGHFLEDKASLAKLKIPDPKHDKRLPCLLEVCERVKSAITDAPVGASAGGPWNLAADLRGIETLIYDTVDDPTFVHELMRFGTEAVKVWGSAVRETGIGLGMGEASASCSVISPTIYREFIKPYHIELVNYFRERKTRISLHICGYIDPIMEDILSLGLGSISIDSPSSLKTLVELSRKEPLIIGNVNTSLFSEGTKEEIEATVKECLRIAAPGGKYLLNSGCVLPFNTTLDRTQYYMEVARKYSRCENLEVLLAG